MEVSIMTSSSGYPLHVNGWELHDNDAMMYWKESPEGYVFIDMTWMDITGIWYRERILRLYKHRRNERLR